MPPTPFTAPTGVSPWDVFERNAVALGTVVQRVASEEAAADLLSAAPDVPVATPGVVEQFPAVAVRCGTFEQRQPTTAVVAPAHFAVAETGSLLVAAPNAERAACLLASRLWLLVRADAMLPTLDAALDQIATQTRAGAPYLMLMSGPSRTADIERVLTVGVHGPAEVRVIVISAPGASQ